MLSLCIMGAVASKATPRTFLKDLLLLTEDLRKCSANIDNAISEVRGLAAVARDELSKIYTRDIIEHVPSGPLELSNNHECVDRSEAAKISSLEAEFVGIDALLVKAARLDEVLRAALADNISDDKLASIVTLDFQEFSNKALFAVRASPPTTDMTLEIVRFDASTLPCSIGPLAFLMTELPPVDVEMRPGRVIPVAGKYRHAIIVFFDAVEDTADLIVEPENEESAPRLQTVDFSATPRIAHTGSWSGCGGNPRGIAHCSGSGNCKGGACTVCGASTHWSCCGDSFEGSAYCVFGTTARSATLNGQSMSKHSPVPHRCDTIPGVHFAPAAYGTLIKGQPCGPMRDAVRAAMTRDEIIAGQKEWKDHKARGVSRTTAGHAAGVVR